MVELLLQTIKAYINSDTFDAETEVSLDFRDELGRTPLYNACYYGFYDVVKSLIDFHMEPEHSSHVTLNVNAAVKNSQRTPLHVAVRKGSLEIVQLLLSIKDVEINLEARPSGRTQLKLIDTFQKTFNVITIPQPPRRESIQEEEEGGDDMSDDFPHASPDLPLSPPGTRTPDTVSSFSLSSLTSATSRTSISSASPGIHIDDSVGCIVAPVPSVLGGSRGSYGSLPKPSPSPVPRSYSTVPKKWHKKHSNELVASVNDGVLPLEAFTNKKRSQTDADGLDSGQSNLRIYEVPKTGRLEFQLKDSSGGKDFDTLLMTPLAEACACFHTKIMRLLLLRGARDDSGMACRIAHLIQRPDLIQLILSHHTTLKENFQLGENTEDSIESIPNLELNWTHMKLPHCEGEWLGPEAEYYPIWKDLERDFEGTGCSSRSGGVLSLQQGPDVSVRCDAISVVHLDSNQLMSVPLELFQLQGVQKINLSNNHIARLPGAPDTRAPDTGATSGWSCPFLTELNVSRNDLLHIPACVWGLPNLKKFLCSKNKLEHLLPDVGPVDEDLLSVSLESVDLSSNALSGKISRFLFELPGLRMLNLSQNSIAKLPETLWGCDTLQDLNLSGNQLSGLPWCEPEKVYRVSFHNQSYVHPVPMQQASGKVLVGKVVVKAPVIDRNKSIYQRAPSTIRPLNTAREIRWSDTADLCDYSSLQRLNLSSNKFATFPEALACFAPNITDLDLSRNPLRELDVQFLPPLLKKLSAKDCEISRIGNVISKSHQMQVLQNCRHGKTVGLACQHRSHAHLPALTTMELSKNRITSLQLIRHSSSDDYTDFGKLENEYDHKIAPVLDLLYPALEGLSLIGNNLEGRFNPNIGHQTHLKWIRLSGNPNLEQVPMEFAYLKNTKQLTELRIDNLPNLTEPPAEYQKVGLSHLLVYMRSRLRE